MQERDNAEIAQRSFENGYSIAKLAPEIMNPLYLSLLIGWILQSLKSFAILEQEYGFNTPMTEEMISILVNHELFQHVGNIMPNFVFFLFGLLSCMHWYD